MIYTQYWNQIDKNPANVMLAETQFGKAAILILFGFFLMPLCDWWPAVMVVLTLITYCPNYRAWGLLLGGVFVLFYAPWLLSWMDNMGLKGLRLGVMPRDHQQIYFIADILLTIAFNMGLVFLSRRFKFILLNPVASVCTIIFSLCILITFIPQDNPKTILLRSFVIVYAYFIWFVAYSIHDSRVPYTRSRMTEYARYLSIWGGSATLFPKGPAYLQQYVD
jgi:hypothetical protein